MGLIEAEINCIGDGNYQPVQTLGAKISQKRWQMHVYSADKGRNSGTGEEVKYMGRRLTQAEQSHNLKQSIFDARLKALHSARERAAKANAADNPKTYLGGFIRRENQSAEAAACVANEAEREARKAVDDIVWKELRPSALEAGESVREARENHSLQYVARRYRKITGDKKADANNLVSDKSVYQ